MKKILLILIISAGFLSCKDQIVTEPERLVDKEKMVDVIYDLALLDGLRQQSLSTAEFKEINPTQYILKKYKIDSLQFAKSNTFYAANYKEYKIMFDEVSKRLIDNKSKVDSLIKRDAKKAVLLKKETFKIRPLKAADAPIKANIERKAEELIKQ